MNPKTCFAMRLTPSSLTIAAAEKGVLLRSEKIFLREMPEEKIAGRVRAFAAGGPVRGILMIPRSDVIQKELAFPAGGGSPLYIRKALEAELAAVLPFPLREMSYGIRLDEAGESARGLVMALPEKRVHEIIDFLARIEIRAEEIITEDQALAWAVFQYAPAGEVLTLERDEERVLVVLARGGRLLASRAMPLQSIPAEARLPEILSETSLFLLEMDAKPERLFLSGLWEESSHDQVFGQFHLRPEVLSGGNSRAETILGGALLYESRRALSLLPHAVKLRNWNRSRIEKWQHARAGAAAVFAAVLLLQIFYTGLGIIRAGGAEKKAKLAESKSMEIQNKIADLEIFARAAVSRKRSLDLVKQTALNLPKDLRLHALTLSPDAIGLKAEADSHAVIPEVMRGIENLPGGGPGKANLSHTRLQRRMNQDVFEFEIDMRRA